MTKLLILTLLLCMNFANAQTHSDKYIMDDDGIAVEKPEIKKQHDDVYNADNTIYTAGRIFTYSYYYQNTAGEKFLLKKGKALVQPGGYSTYDWELVEPEKQDSETVALIIMKPVAGNPFEKDMPDYNQTAIRYEYMMNNGEYYAQEVTGAIENEMNVWIHPPRNGLFKLLELNPFPYIKVPYTKGTGWKWKLHIGDHWSDKRWLEWTGGVDIHYEYEIKERKTITTKLGRLDCYIIHATAASRIGETELVAYFNPQLGFVKLEYKNINGTQTVLELEKAE